MAGRPMAGHLVPRSGRPRVAGRAWVACPPLACLGVLLAAAPAAAEPTPTNPAGQVEVVLKNHRFTPSEIHVKAGQRSQLLIKNQDGTADEFDSTDLKVEKVIGGGTEGLVRLHALDPGRYGFMGEFHSETAQGVVVAE